MASPLTTMNHGEILGFGSPRGLRELMIAGHQFLRKGQQFRGQPSALRRQYGELLRLEIAHTVVGLEEVDEELRHLREALRG